MLNFSSSEFLSSIINAVTHSNFLIHLWWISSLFSIHSAKSNQFSWVSYDYLFSIFVLHYYFPFAKFLSLFSTSVKPMYKKALGQYCCRAFSQSRGMKDWQPDSVFNPARYLSWQVARLPHHKMGIIIAFPYHCEIFRMQMKPNLSPSKGEA